MKVFTIYGHGGDLGHAAKVFEKSTFSYRKALVTKFDLAVKVVKVPPVPSFE